MIRDPTIDLTIKRSGRMLVITMNFPSEKDAEAARQQINSDMLDTGALNIELYDVEDFKLSYGEVA